MRAGGLSSRAGTEMTEAEPVRYGHYTLGRLIGRGGMALVYTARNEHTGAEVAVKIVPGRPAAEGDTVAARFRHEAEIAAKLSHPNIVRVYDFFVADGTSVLVMELLRGESLATFLQRRGKLSVAETLAVAFPILTALEHTHGQGVIHRDVKASNIFLAVEANGAAIPKLLDFGIANRPGANVALTAADEVLGTPSAMSPEQIRGGSLDGRSDLFSFAGMLVELLTGVAPFHASSASASLAAVLEREIDPPPEIPPRLFVELERALRKRPLERPRSAQELEHALREACADESTVGALAVGTSSMTVAENTPTLTSPPIPFPASAPGRAPSRRGRTAALVASGALVVTLAALGATRAPPRRVAPPPAPPPHTAAAAAITVAAPGSGAEASSAPLPSPATEASVASAAASAPGRTPKPKPASKPPAKPVATRPDF